MASATSPQVGSRSTAATPARRRSRAATPPRSRPVVYSPGGWSLAPHVAVANDGFGSVNPNAGFSPPNLWAPFNSNTTQFRDRRSYGAGGRARAGGDPRPRRHVRQRRELGTTIQYYSGGQAPARQPQPVPQGATSFDGVLFADPVVTRVVITLGTAEIFSFDGSTVTADSTPSNTMSPRATTSWWPSPAPGDRDRRRYRRGAGLDVACQFRFERCGRRHHGNGGLGRRHRKQRHDRSRKGEAPSP